MYIIFRFVRGQRRIECTRINLDYIQIFKWKNETLDFFEKTTSKTIYIYVNISMNFKYINVQATFNF